MARTAVGLGIRELAAAAKVSMDTIARFERGEALKERTIEALQRALEAAGIEFTNGEQPGVRLSKRAAAHHVKIAGSSNSTPGAQAPRRKTAEATEKKR
jgi:transcriptional regulator with XRE-family HTH domain